MASDRTELYTEFQYAANGSYRMIDLFTADEESRSFTEKTLQKHIEAMEEDGIACPVAKDALAFLRFEIAGL